MLHVRDLRVVYDDTVAVSDIDLDVSPGETLALLGRSGSGKTTVLRAIAGLVPIDAGTIELSGLDLTGVPTHRRRIGLVFQDFALFPHLDVAANVAYGLHMTGADDVESTVAAALRLVGLDALGGRRIDQLSGGQAQRVALARTLVAEPDLLLLDEPLGSLDPDLRGELAGELAALLRRSGTPAIVVTHDTAEAFALGDRVAVIVDGEVVVTGAPDTVWSDPRSAAAARLLGHRNLITTTVIDRVVTIGHLELTVDRPDGPTTALIRPGSITSPGPTKAAVHSARYAGPGWMVTIALEGGTAEVPVSIEPETGSAITVAIDPDGVTLLDQP